MMSLHVAKTNDISIHAAREGGDESHEYSPNSRIVFQSTPPVKAATVRSFARGTVYRISIHAAREGGDFLLRICFYICPNFNPRRP